ncbi:MAG: tRNA lysidine(34) synthetase TilS [Puniceicoccales bacterium]|nr:tRNA lysidine(34) synthetase TilS [Puniceicoccales bacterium]
MSTDADGNVELSADLLQLLRNVAPQKICLACSGGSDSMALASLLSADKSLRASLHLLHFDHGMRGKKSREDGEFVGRFSRSMGLAISIGKRSEVTAAGHGEDYLRRCRFQFFHGEMRRLGTPYLLTAHHRDDVLETFLLRLSRGAGLDGLVALRSIENRRDGLIYVRPLLNFSKSQLRRYLLARGIPWREDESNGTDDYLRNRIRHRLMPLWKGLEPGRNFPASLLRTRALLTEDGEALAQISRQKFHQCYGPEKNILRAAELVQQPSAILRRVLHLYFLENFCPLERKLADYLCEKLAAGKSFQATVNKNLTAIFSGENFTLEKK